VEKAMGGRAATESFFRLFMVPGMFHCFCGDGANEIDSLAYLEEWVEHEQPPNEVIGAHVDDAYLMRHEPVEADVKLSKSVLVQAFSFEVSP